VLEQNIITPQNHHILTHIFVRADLFLLRQILVQRRSGIRSAFLSLIQTFCIMILTSDDMQKNNLIPAK
jgi:hypothetical protein